VSKKNRRRHHKRNFKQHQFVVGGDRNKIDIDPVVLWKRKIFKFFRNYYDFYRFGLENLKAGARKANFNEKIIPRLSVIILISACIFLLGIKIPILGEEEKPVLQFESNFKVSPIPVLGQEPLPHVSAFAFAVIDGDSWVTLAQNNLNQKMPPASLTKLMTALVSLDFYNSSDIFTVKRLIRQKDEAEMGLEVGDRLSVRNLMYGLLVPSGNDAAYALADNFPGGIENFIFAMNKKAKYLHLEGTHFENPSGLDISNHYSTAYDLLLLAREAVENQEIKYIVATKEIVLPNSDSSKYYFLKNVNKLLGNVPGVNGIKTGNTELAGQCLITSTTRKGHTIYTIVLKSSDRFLDSVKLLEWAFRNTQWKTVNI
jgi:D-alanyl-D-alanine carboxypeptidase